MTNKRSVETTFGRGAGVSVEEMRAILEGRDGRVWVDHGEQHIGADSVLVDVDGARALVSPGRHRFSDPDENFDVEVELGMVGDELGVSGVTVRPRPGGPPITARAMQAIPTGRYVAQAVDGSTLWDDSSTNTGVTRAQKAFMRYLRAARPGSLTGRTPGRPGTSDEELRFFADAYRQAKSEGPAWVEKVRRAYDRPEGRRFTSSLSTPALRKRRQRAVDAGFLP